MTREIIDFDEFGDFSIITFSMGKGNGEGVQITINNRECYTQLKRDKAIECFEVALKRLKEQVEEDKINPPFWQVIQAQD